MTDQIMAADKTRLKTSLSKPRKALGRHSKGQEKVGELPEIVLIF